MHPSAGRCSSRSDRACGALSLSLMVWASTASTTSRPSGRVSPAQSRKVERKPCGTPAGPSASRQRGSAPSAPPIHPANNVRQRRAGWRLALPVARRRQFIRTLHRRADFRQHDIRVGIGNARQRILQVTRMSHVTKMSAPKPQARQPAQDGSADQGAGRAVASARIMSAPLPFAKAAFRPH